MISRDGSSLKMPRVHRNGSSTAPVSRCPCGARGNAPAGSFPVAAARSYAPSHRLARRRNRISTEASTASMSSTPDIPLFKVFMAPAKELDKPVTSLLHSGYITQGKKVEEFEEHLRKFFGNVRAHDGRLFSRVHPVAPTRRCARAHARICTLFFSGARTESKLHLDPKFRPVARSRAC